MTIRIEPDLADTQKLLEQVLPHLMQDERVAFCVPAGQSSAILTRMRVMISRKRKSLAARGRKTKQFRLCSTVHPETHEGIRMECIVLERQVTEMHMMTELLGDVLSHG